MAGKGDTRRPPAVPQHTIDDNWSRTFPNSNTKPKASSSDTSPATSAEAATTTPSITTVILSALDVVLARVEPRKRVRGRRLVE